MPKLLSSDPEDDEFNDWYREVIRLCIAEHGYHPEAIPVAGYWRDWHRGGHSPRTALDQFAQLLVSG